MRPDAQGGGDHGWPTQGFNEVVSGHAANKSLSVSFVKPDPIRPGVTLGRHGRSSLGMDAVTPVNLRDETLKAATGQRLKRLRQAKGYGGHGQQQHFAKIIGLRSNHLTMTEKGERPLQPAVALEIKRLFGATLDWLYGGDESGLPDQLRRAIHASITET